MGEDLNGYMYFINSVLWDCKSGEGLDFEMVNPVLTWARASVWIGYGYYVLGMLGMLIGTMLLL